MSVIRRYKELPEAKAIPEILWNVQKILDLITEYETQINMLKIELNTLLPEMMSTLKADWSDEELIHVGLMNRRYDPTPA